MPQTSAVQLQNLLSAAPTPAPQPQQCQSHTLSSLTQPNAPQLSPPAQIQHGRGSCWSQLKPSPPTKLQMAVFGLALSVLSLFAAWLGLVPGFQGTKYGKISAQIAKASLELDAWQARVTFRECCQGKSVFKAISFYMSMVSGLLTMP